MHQGGLSGRWTHYVLTQRQSDHPIEHFLLNRAPVVKATQQRFQIFQQIIQAQIQDGVSFASIPSGFMGDLLLLDYRRAERFELAGIDLDPESLEGAKALAKERGLEAHVRLFLKDAWNLGVSGQYDLIASNGLNIYEPSEERTIALYRQFLGALKPGGLLVTSFLTPPPGQNHRCEWDMKKISMEDLFLQKIISADILESRWRCFQTREQMENVLRSAGYSEIEVIYDEARIFPTMTARR
jgi:SAM-dependent methyltransferase